ncbi:MAG: LysR family transcriptional regulator [Asgard group archaeon]|nr:LysR family transcriptional regulator [Asgard group archaeon]
MSNDFTVHIKIWLEKNNESILGPGRIRILEAIEETGSLTLATKKCDISFRKAWKLLNDINEILEQPVIITERGGKGGGGGTKLTEYGRKLIRQYKALQNKLEKIVEDPSLWKEL